LFYKNCQARKEYLIYCNTLKFAICVDPLILKGDQRDQMQNVFIKPWSKSNGVSYGAYYPQVERKNAALQLLIANSQIDDPIDILSNQVEKQKKMNQPENNPKKVYND
jgi:hypothetical protein